MALTEFTSQKDANDVAQAVRGNGTKVKVVGSGSKWSIVPDDKPEKSIAPAAARGGIGLSSMNPSAPAQHAQRIAATKEQRRTGSIQRQVRPSTIRRSDVSHAANEATQTISSTTTSVAREGGSAMSNVGRGLKHSLSNIRKSMTNPEQEGRPSIAAMPAHKRDIRIASQPNLSAIKDDSYGHTLTGQGF